MIFSKPFDRITKIEIRLAGEHSDGGRVEENGDYITQEDIKDPILLSVVTSCRFQNDLEKLKGKKR